MNNRPQTEKGRLTNDHSPTPARRATARTGPTCTARPGRRPLAAVRKTAADLLASSPVPPATLNVRAGEVSVEMGWAVGEVVAGRRAGRPAAASAAVADARRVPVGETIKAATVGVFYRVAVAGRAAVRLRGRRVSRGQQIAIIEAMKLMLPVEADKGGRVAEVLVADGEAVEYGQPLFRLAAEHEPGQAA